MPKANPYLAAVWRVLRADNYACVDRLVRAGVLRPAVVSPGPGWARLWGPTDVADATIARALLDLGVGYANCAAVLDCWRDAYGPTGWLGLAPDGPCWWPTPESVASEVKAGAAIVAVATPGATGAAPRQETP